MPNQSRRPQTEEEKQAKALRISVAYYRRLKRRGGAGDDLCRAYVNLTGGHYNDLMLGMRNWARGADRSVG